MSPMYFDGKIQIISKISKFMKIFLDIKCSKRIRKIEKDPKRIPQDFRLVLKQKGFPRSTIFIQIFINHPTYCLGENPFQ